MGRGLEGMGSEQGRRRGGGQGRVIFNLRNRHFLPSEEV